MGVTKKSTVKLGVAGIVGIAVVMLFMVMFAVERIDSGQTGIIVNLAGSERGVDDAKVETGWVVYNRFVKQLFEYPALRRLWITSLSTYRIRRVPSLRRILPLNIILNARMRKLCSCVIARLPRSWSKASS